MLDINQYCFPMFCSEEEEHNRHHEFLRNPFSVCKRESNLACFGVSEVPQMVRHIHITFKAYILLRWCVRFKLD